MAHLGVTWSKEIELPILNWNWSAITWVLLLELLQFCYRLGILFRQQLLQPTELLQASVAIQQSSDLGLPFGFICYAESTDGWGNAFFFPPCSMPGEVLVLEGAKQSRSWCTNGLVIAVLGWRCLHWSRRRGRWMGGSKDSSQTPRSTGADWSCEYNSTCGCYEMCTELPKPKPTSHPFVLEEILREQNSSTC